MTIETTRLMIHTASLEEMLRIIDSQKDDILRKAYQEMLKGCFDHTEHWVWYAVWIIECKDGSHVEAETEPDNKASQRVLEKCGFTPSGNDCSACPRYVAHPFEKSEEELQHTADLWMRIGYRDHVAAIHEESIL